MATGERTGTQSVERAVLLLRQLARKGRFGWTLSDLAGACDLNIKTTHRLLGTLVREGMAQRRAIDRHYLPGPLLFELGLSVPGFSDFSSAYNAPLQYIADRLGGTAYLLLRSGNDVVIAARTGEAAFTSLSVGARRPLILGAGGVSILLSLPGIEARAAIAKNLQQLAKSSDGRTKAALSVLHRSRACGFGFDDGQIVPGLTALGVPVRDASRAAFGAISVAWPASRFQATHLQSTIETLKAEALKLERETMRVFSHPAALLPAALLPPARRSSRVAYIRN